MTQKYTEEELSKEAFVEDTKRDYIGKEVEEGRRDEPIRLDWRQIKDTAWGLGDDNPLFCDPAYAAKTRFGGQIAPPTIIASLRYPVGRGSQLDKPYRVNNFYSGDKMEWFDVIRPGDAIRTSLVLTDTEIKEGKIGPLVFYYSDGNFWNQSDRLIAKQRGTLILIELPPGKTFGEKMHYELEAYKYSEEEVESIVKDYDSEYRRGSKALYWEDVKVGDKLQPVVKGPLLMGDFIMYRVGCRPLSPTSPGTFKLSLNCVRKHPEVMARLNPVLNWPWDNYASDHEDVNLARYRGLPLPFDLGLMRTQLAGHILTNWMGDDGFLRMLDTHIRKPNYYGDTTWFKGEVVKKYKINEGGIEYGAVDIKIDGINQRGEMSTPCTATVYLPSPGRPIEIPIPVPEETRINVEEWKKGLPKPA